MVDDLSSEHRVVRQVFGESARLDRTMGSGVAPGDVRILAAGRVLGRGRDFHQALRQATVRASWISSQGRAPR